MTRRSRWLWIHGGALGDCVLSLQVARAAHCGHEDAHCTFVARSSFALWAKKHGAVDDAFPLDRISQALWGRETHDSSLRSVDRMISLLGGDQDELTRSLIARFGKDRVACFDPRPRESTLRNGIHITTQWCADLRGQGLAMPHRLDGTPLVPPQVRKQLQDALHRQLCASQDPVALVHPGSGGRNKCCPLEALERLVLALHKTGRRVAWMIGPDEMEREGAEQKLRLERTAPVFFEESLEAASDLVAGSDWFVGNDAGMTHVASAAGVRTIALFGPTDPRVWRPLGPQCTVARFPGDPYDSKWTEQILREFLPNSGAAGN